jgi:hypothetical protein
LGNPVFDLTPALRGIWLHSPLLGTASLERASGLHADYSITLGTKKRPS